MATLVDCEYRILAMKQNIIQEIAGWHTKEYQSELKQMERQIAALKVQNIALEKAMDAKEIDVTGLGKRWELQRENGAQKDEIERLKTEMNDLRTYMHSMRSEFVEWCASRHSMSPSNTKKFQLLSLPPEDSVSAKIPRISIKLPNSNDADFSHHSKSPLFSPNLKTIMDECLDADFEISSKRERCSSTDSLRSLPLLLPDDSQVQALEAELEDEIENHLLSKERIQVLSEELESTKFMLDQRQNRIRELEAIQKESVDRSLYEQCQMELETTRHILAAKVVEMNQYKKMSAEKSTQTLTWPTTMRESMVQSERLRQQYSHCLFFIVLSLLIAIVPEQVCNVFRLCIDVALSLISELKKYSDDFTFPWC